MSLPEGWPSLPEVESANWNYLKAASVQWPKIADQWESAFTEIHEASKRPGGTVWEGPAADAVQGRTDKDVVTVRGPAEQLREAGAVAGRGYEQQTSIQRLILSAVDDAQRDGFNVASDYIVTDTNTSYDSAVARDERAKAAQVHEDLIKYHVSQLVSGEHDINTNITKATEGLDALSFPDDAADGGAGATNGQVTLVDDVLKPGQARDLGPIAGTGADGGIPGIGAADLGEVVQLPDGSYVAVFGDSFAGDRMGADPHYPSVAVPVTFDSQGKPHFGAPLTGPDGSPNVLFPLPPLAAGTNSLPAGSIRMRDGTAYMMAAGTKDLHPDGGSWLVKATNDPSQGWKPIDGSWRPGNYAAGEQSQISGFQAADGNVYIAADAFDRTQGVGYYRADPDHVADRSAWQPWTGNGWGTPGQSAAPVTDPGTRFGELSFREVDGKAVLSGFNASNGPGAVEVRVANSPTDVFNPNTPTTAVAQQNDPKLPGYLLQSYGGYILPNSTLDNMNLFVSQWNTHTNAPYNVQEFQVNPHR